MAETPSLPPRGSWFSEQASEIAFAGFRALEESSKHKYLSRIQEHMVRPEDRDTPLQRRAAKAIASVREAHDIHLSVNGSDELTSYAYDTLQQERCDRHDWPPIATVRRWLGARTWNEVLARCHLPQAPEGDSLQVNWNHPYDQPEAIAAIRACANDLRQSPSWWDYLHWSARTDVRRRPGRRPRSQSVFDRLWPRGGWHAALASALCDGDDADGLGRKNAVGVVVPAGYRYSLTTLRKTLQLAAKEMGSDFGASDYQSWRLHQFERRRADKQPLNALPSRAAYYNRYERWSDAMADAGLVASSWPTSPIGRGRHPFLREAMEGVMREAYAATGEPFTKASYTAWREERVASHDPRRLPTVETICRRFGGWKAAHLAILEWPRDWW